KFLDHAAKWSGDREIVTADAGEVTGRIGYAALRARSNRLSGALTSLGLGLGDRVGTLAWNTQHHLEMYYAVMGAGLVCHPLNPRLTAAHLAATINEAEDHALAVSSSLAPLLMELAPLCPTLEHLIIMDDEAHETARDLNMRSARVWTHEALLEARGAAMRWG